MSSNELDNPDSHIEWQSSMQEYHRFIYKAGLLFVDLRKQQGYPQDPETESILFDQSNNSWANPDSPVSTDTSIWLKQLPDQTLQIKIESNTYDHHSIPRVINIENSFEPLVDFVQANLDKQKKESENPLEAAIENVTDGNKTLLKHSETYYILDPSKDTITVVETGQQPKEVRIGNHEIDRELIDLHSTFKTHLSYDLHTLVKAELKNENITISKETRKKILQFLLEEIEVPKKLEMQNQNSTIYGDAAFFGEFIIPTLIYNVHSTHLSDTGLLTHIHIAMEQNFMETPLVEELELPTPVLRDSVPFGSLSRIGLDVFKRFKTWISQYGEHLPDTISELILNAQKNLKANSGTVQGTITEITYDRSNQSYTFTYYKRMPKEAFENQTGNDYFIHRRENSEDPSPAELEALMHLL